MAGLTAKLVEVRRCSENQTARCKHMLKKVKAIQFQEVEDYGEKQFEGVVRVLADKKNIRLKEAVVPEFLQKKKLPIPPPDAFEPGDLAERKRNFPPELDSKQSRVELEDVSHVLRNTIKELLLSTVPLGKDDEDTDSCSEWEDEVQQASVISINNSATEEREQELLYLRVDHNPATEWARFRLEIIRTLAWLKDSIRNIEMRVSQQNQLLKYIEKHKPAFQFEAEPMIIKPTELEVATDDSLDYATVKLYREGSQGSEKSGPTNEPGRFPPTGTWEHMVTTFGKIKQELASDIAENAVKREGNVVGGGLEALQLRVESPWTDNTTSRRCLGLIRPYRHRKVLQIGGIHNVVGKAILQPSTLCRCFGRTELCVVCSGRSDKVRRVRPGAMPKPQTTALLDHTYHKVLSGVDDKPIRLFAEAALKAINPNKTGANTLPLKPTAKSSGKQKPSGRSSGKQKQSTFFDDLEISESDQDMEPEESKTWLQVSCPRPTPGVTSEEGVYEKKVTNRRQSASKKNSDKKPDRKIRKRKFQSQRLSDDEDEDEDDASEHTWTPRKATNELVKRRRGKDNGKYDIDHIVIPYSIAAATRVEKIEYKEIDIPSWRLNPIEQVVPVEIQKPKGKRGKKGPRSSKKKDPTVGADANVEKEDLSLEAIKARHMRSELDEKKRFLKNMNLLSHRRNRKSETKAESSEAIPGTSTSVSPPTVDTTENIFKTDEISISTANQISAADASLAVTALKIAAAPTSPNAAPATTAASTAAASVAAVTPSRRRTLSACKTEEEECEEPGIPPYETRRFPLSDDDYASMVDEMNDAYQERDGDKVVKEEGPISPAVSSNSDEMWFY